MKALRQHTHPVLEVHELAMPRLGPRWPEHRHLQWQGASVLLVATVRRRSIADTASDSAVSEWAAACRCITVTGQLTQCFHSGNTGFCYRPSMRQQRKSTTQLHKRRCAQLHCQAQSNGNGAQSSFRQNVLSNASYGLCWLFWVSCTSMSRGGTHRPLDTHAMQGDTFI